VDILVGGDPAEGTGVPFKEGTEGEKMIEPAPSPPYKPGFITTLVPKKLQGQLRIGIVLVLRVSPDPFLGIFF
jgi:hypothetical protein